MDVRDIYAAVQAISKIQDTQPQNNVSLFIFQTFDKLFSGDVKDLNILKSLAVTFANKDPEKVLTKIADFIQLYQSFVEEEFKKFHDLPDQGK